MTVRRLQPAPRAWLYSLGSAVQRWLERVTLYMLITGRVDATLDPASVSANTTAEETFTVKGVREGDLVRAIKPSHTTGLAIGNVRASATDTVAIQFVNVTGSPIDPPSETYRIYFFRWNEG